MLSILIADDERHIREGLAALIREQGEYHVCGVASDGEEALRLAQTEQPDIVLTDINMPHMNGLAFIAGLQHNEVVPIVIIISGYDDFSYAREAMRLGVKDYLLKPIDRAELLCLLKSVAADVCERRERLEALQKERTSESISFLQQLLCESPDYSGYRNELRYGASDLMAQFYAVGITEKALPPMEKLALNGKLRVVAFPMGERRAAVLLIGIQYDVNCRAQFEMQANEVLKELCHPAYCSMGASVDTLEDIRQSYEMALRSLPYAASFSRIVHSVVRACVEKMCQRYPDPALCLDDLARDLFVNPNYLRGLFKQHTGVSFIKYLTSLRLKKSALLLTDTQTPISEIAKAVGYTDAQYFSMSFKRQYGCTPSAYRENGQKE